MKSLESSFAFIQLYVLKIKSSMLNNLFLKNELTFILLICGENFVFDFI